MKIYKCDGCNIELKEKEMQVVFAEQETLEFCDNCFKKYREKEEEYHRKEKELRDDYIEKIEKLRRDIFSDTKETKQKQEQLTQIPPKPEKLKNIHIREGQEALKKGVVVK